MHKFKSYVLSLPKSPRIFLAREPRHTGELSTTSATLTGRRYIQAGEPNTLCSAFDPIFTRFSRNSGFGRSRKQKFCQFSSSFCQNFSSRQMTKKCLDFTSIVCYVRQYVTSQVLGVRHGVSRYDGVMSGSGTMTKKTWRDVAT